MAGGIASLVVNWVACWVAGKDIFVTTAMAVVAVRFILSFLTAISVLLEVIEATFAVVFLSNATVLLAKETEVYLTVPE